MDRPSESDLAWDVVEQNRSHLDAAELNTIFVKRVAGEYESVIAAALKAVVREGATVEPELRPGGRRGSTAMTGTASTIDCVGY